MNDSIQLASAETTKKQNLQTVLINKLSFFVIGLVSNLHIGRIVYALLVVAEYMFMSFLLIQSGYSNSNFNELVDTRKISILKLSDMQTTAFALWCTFYALLIGVFLIFMKILLTDSNYEGIKENSILKRIFAAWIAIQRTILTYLMSFFFITGIQLILQTSKTDQSLQYFILILLSVVGMLFFLILFFISFRIVWMPILLRRLPWASTFVKTQYFKELFKALLISQNLFLPYFFDNRFAIAGYYLFLFLALFILAQQRSIYFDLVIDKVQIYSERFVLSLSLICIFRILFSGQLIILAIFFPVIAFSITKLMDFIEEKRRQRFMLKLDKRELLSAAQFIEAIQYLMKVIERQNENDLKVMQRIQYNHRVSCFDDTCICNNYHYIIVEYFKKSEKSLDTQKSKPCEEESDDKCITSPDKPKEQSSASPAPKIKRKVTFFDKTHDVPPSSFQEEDKSQNEIDVNKISIILNQPTQRTIFDITNEGSFFGTEQMATGAYNGSLVVNDLTIEDLFKDIFLVENMALKLEEQQATKVQNPQNTSIKKLIFKSIKEARRYFFIWLLESIFKEIEFSHQAICSIKSIEFQMIYIDFINQFLQRHFLGVFELLRINKVKGNLGFFDRLTFSICEQQLISEAQTRFKTNRVGGLDYSLYIEGNHEQQELDKLYEVTTAKILSFWKLWKHENPNIEQILSTGRVISKNVKQIRELTTKQQEDQLVRKDIQKYQLYALFHLELLNDPYTSFQMSNYIQNQLTFRNKTKLYGQLVGNGDSLHQQQQMLNEQGICIVQAWGGDNQQWEFIYGNKVLSDLVGCKETQIPGQNINIIMPSGISTFHDDFIKRFYQQGHPRVLGKLRVLYIKDLSGFLVPISFRLNFYYHPKYNYAFIATLEKMKLMNLYFEDHSKINTDDVMAFITDDAMNITDYSQNVLGFTGITQEKWKQQEEVRGKALNLSQIVMNLDEIMQNEFGMSITPSNEFQGLANKRVEYKRYSLQLDRFDENHTIPAILVYFQQVFPTQYEKVRVHTFVVVPCHKLPDFDNVTNTGQDSKLQGNGIANQKTINSLFQNTQTRMSLPQQQPKADLKSLDSKILSHADHSSINDKHYFAEMASMSSHCSSMGSDHNLNGQLAQNLLFQNKTPKVILINVFFLISMLLVFLIVSIYNLSIFLIKYKDIAGRQESFHYIAQRNTKLRASLLDLKVLLEISQNPSILNKSSVIPSYDSRVQVYIDDLKYNLAQINEYSQLFDAFILEHKSFYDFQLNFDGMQFLSEEGDIYTQSVSFKHAVNLYTSYADSIDFVQIFKLQPALNVTAYANQNKDYYNASAPKTKLTDLQRQLFFIFENGLFEMQELGHVQMNMLIKASLQQTDESKQTLNITTFISIAIVSLILIITFPLISRVQQREFQILKFFWSIKKDMLEGILQIVHKYQNNLLARLEGEHSQADSPINRAEMSQPSTEKMTKSDSQYKYQKSILKRITAQFVKQESKNGKKLGGGKKNKKVTGFESALDQSTKRNLNNDQGDDLDEESSRKDEESKDDENNKNGKEDGDETKTQNLDDLLISRNKHIKGQIKRMSVSQKFKIFAILLTAIVYLNSSFLITFYQSQKVFNNDAESSIKISDYFKREECVYDLLLFIMERAIRNQSIPIRVFTSSTDYTIEKAVTYTVNECYDVEASISQIRKAPPDFFSSEGQHINYFEEAQVCKETFPDNLTLAIQCATTLNNLMKQGMGGAMQYLITYIQNLNIKFDSNPALRTIKFIQDMLYNQKLHDSIDFSIYYFKQSFELIQDLVQEACYSYFDKAKTQFVLTFGIYISVTILISMIFGIILYRRVKQRLLDIQNILILIPLNDIDNNHRIKIETFINK